jgi:type II restriction/modification system DNA methylase subunit YeeA
MHITRRPADAWVIDFGTDTPEADAALYELPFEYLKKHAYPFRLKNKREGYRKRWWIHGEPRPELRAAIAPLARFIATPGVSKHRLFTWLTKDMLPDHAVFAFARDDDYFFGVLHSRVHEVWALHMGTALEDRPRYTPTSTFETFPFPWPPGTEPKDDPQVKAIGDAARELVEKRDAWLNPPGTTEQERRDRTLTNLYNKRPEWLIDAHRTLDETVFAAYGWPHTLTDSEILERLLALNHERTAKSQKTVAG